MNLLFHTYDAAGGQAARNAGGTAGLRLDGKRSIISRRSAEQTGSRPSAPAAHSLFRLKSSVHITLVLFIFAFIYPSILMAVPAGTPITNTATANYLANGSVASVASSNTSTITAVELRTPSTLEVFQYAPASSAAVPSDVRVADYSTSGTAAGPFVSLSTPTAPGGNPINIAAPVPLVPATQYHITEPMFIRVTDLDQNLDPAVVETVLVTVTIGGGDTEVVRLAETGTDTGVFSGYLPTGHVPGAPGSGQVNAQSGDTILFSYTDSVDGSDTHAGSVLVDPFGLVINSLTGQPVNGATITIIDAATGQPAVVFGDDGISAFPATVTSGGSATDSGNTVYTFPPGGYRFPFVLPGNYRYRITPPANFRAPSTVPTASLQALPGGPFAIVPGSRGEIFAVNPGPALHIDIPVDPTGTRLYIQKTAGRTTIAVGEHLPYRVTIENVDAASPVTSVVVHDRLPHGFRYKNGTARIDGAPASDPALSSDGRTLSFSLGTLAPARKAEVSYVASAGAGARPGTATNTVYAIGDLGAASNTASASVKVEEDLFREKATIVGRILADGCGDASRAEGKGVEGVRIFLEDGTYTITDGNGMFHFTAVETGSHVVQLDTETVPKKYEVLMCEENTRFAGAAHSQFVDIQGGMLWRTDFHLGLRPKLRGSAGIALSSAVRSASAKTAKSAPSNLLDYDVIIDADMVPLRNARISIMLPDNLSYVPGSSMLDGSALADPEVLDNTLTYRLDELVSGGTGTIRFTAAVTPPPGFVPFTTRAVLTADTPEAKNVRTPVAENKRELIVLSEKQATPDMLLRPRFTSGSSVLSRKDRLTMGGIVKKLKKLDIAYVKLTGHSDSIPIRSKRARYKDNYELARARAESVAEFIRKALKLEKNQIETVSQGPDQPVASNKTPKGRALNRRVELQVYSIRVISWAEVKREKSTSERKTVETVGLRPGEVWLREDRPDAGPGRQAGTEEYTAAWMDTLRPGFELLQPLPGHYPSIPSIKIAVKHSRDERIGLRLNGKDVASVYFDGTMKRSDGVTVSLWRGVHLNDGDNTIEVSALDADGVLSGEIKRSLHYSTPPVKAEIVPERSFLVADGRTPPVIAVKFTDKEGHPARTGILGEYSVDPPHLPRQKEEDLRQIPLSTSSSERQQYQVGSDGIALIELQPTSRTGEAVIRLNLADGTQEVRAWVRPEDRGWILVGLAEGTAGYNTVSGNRESLSASDGDEDLFREGRVAFYAKGKIKGEWLLTLAYDSKKPWRKDERSLHQIVDPTQYYTLYGDATTQASDAASSRRLYVKLERDQFYALFGDYATGLTVTELSRYNRNLNGLKSGYKGGNLDVTVFASDTSQAFVKDEIRGDGTSGLYHLSRKNIVLNSETVTIETRDRFRSELIVNSQRLSRWLDYTIDYESGTIFFKAPVQNRDANFNPVFIVIDYESFDSSDLFWNYGGRAAVHTSDRKIEVGTTYVHEGRSGGEGNLTGLDAKIAVDDRTHIRAEIAETKSETGSTTVEGAAYLAEVVHKSGKLDTRAYIREQEQDFGLGQQNGSENGTRKIGLDAAYRFDTTISLRGEAFRRYNLSTGAARDVAQIQGLYAANRYELGAGFRFAEDSFITGDNLTSEQFFMNARYRMTDRATATAGHDQSLPGSNDNADYPTRTTVGMEYKLTDTAVLFGAQEFTKGAAADTSTTRVGFRASPWSGSTLSSSIENQQTESGTRLFSVSGLKQSWQLSPKWSIDAGLDRSATIRETTSGVFNTNTPPASGGEDFTAVSLGAGYKEQKWSWTGRIEKRDSESEDKLGFFTGAAGEARPGLGIAGSVQAFKTTAQAGKSMNTDLRIGVAYRPVEGRWIVLDRIDYIRQKDERALSEYDNWRVVNNAVANVRSGRVQLSIQYGSKYVNETIDASDFSGYTHLPGLEVRYDVTKRWDVGVRGSMLQTWETGQADFGSGVSVGYTVARNLWLSVGYNLTGFRDRDFSRSEFTSQGVFFKIRMKFDQAAVRDAVKWVTGQ